MTTRSTRTSLARCPASTQFDVQAPGVVTLVGPVIGQMQAARADYARASDIPTSWLPLSSAPWLFLGIGGLLVAVGALALVRPQRLATLALLVVGLGIVDRAPRDRIPGKVDAAVRVTKLGRVGLAPATGQKAVGATKLFDGMADDVRTKLEPALAQAAPSTDFPQSYPTLARFADEWQRSTSAKSHALSDSQVAVVEHVRERRPDPAAPDSVAVHHSRDRPRRARGCRRSFRSAGAWSGAEAKGTEALSPS